jgi:RsiW-degrading membrane proteinase PrsW (M82 family)
MQYSTRSLFAMVTAAALLVGFAGLPDDFKSFLVAYALLFAGVGGCFYIAGRPDIPQWYVAVFVVLWTAAVVIAVLNEPVGRSY